MDITNINVEEIYQKLVDIESTVKMVEDPRTQSPDYITANIDRVCKGVREINKVYVKVFEELKKVKSLLRLKKLELERRVEFKLQLPEVRNLEMPYLEKLSHIKAVVDKEYQKEFMESTNKLIEESPTLRDHIRLLEDEEFNLSGLLKTVNEARAQLKQQDSGIRLQKQVIEMHAKAFGVPPIAFDTPPKRPRKRTSIQLEQDWEVLTKDDIISGKESEILVNPSDLINKES